MTVFIYNCNYSLQNGYVKISTKWVLPSAWVYRIQRTGLNFDYINIPLCVKPKCQLVLLTTLQLLLADISLGPSSILEASEEWASPIPEDMTGLCSCVITGIDGVVATAAFNGRRYSEDGTIEGNLSAWSATRNIIFILMHVHKGYRMRRKKVFKISVKRHDAPLGNEWGKESCTLGITYNFSSLEGRCYTEVSNLTW